MSGAARTPLRASRGRRPQHAFAHRPCRHGRPRLIRCRHVPTLRLRHRQPALQLRPGGRRWHHHRHLHRRDLRHHLRGRHLHSASLCAHAASSNGRYTPSSPCAAALQKAWAAALATPAIRKQPPGASSTERGCAMSRSRWSSLARAVATTRTRSKRGRLRRAALARPATWSCSAGRPTRPHAQKTRRHRRSAAVPTIFTILLQHRHPNFRSGKWPRS